MKFKYVICPHCKKEHIVEQYTSGFTCECKKILMIDLDEKDIKKIKREWAKSARIMCCDNFELFQKLLREDEDENIFFESIKIEFPDNELLKYAKKTAGQITPPSASANTLPQ